MAQAWGAVPGSGIPPPREAVVKAVILGTLLTLVALGQPDATDAQDNRRGFWVHGYVQWIAGSKLMLTADSGAPVAIDISELDQRAYQAVEQGEGITIAGVIKPPVNVDDRFMPYLAHSIRRDRP
jgi:hypothetical protein